MSEVASGLLEPLQEKLASKYLIKSKGSQIETIVKIDPILKAFTASAKSSFYICSIFDPGGRLIDQDFVTDLHASGAVKKLETIWQRNTEFKKLLDETSSLQGLERARGLDACFDKIPRKNVSKFFADLLGQMFALDPEDTLHLKAKYGSSLRQTSDVQIQSAPPGVVEKIRELGKNTSDAAVMEVIEKFLSEKPLSIYDQQFAMMRKYHLLQKLNKLGESQEVLKDIVLLDAESRIGIKAKSLIETEQK